MRIAFLIFDDLTALDAIGPFEVLCRIPGAEVMFVGETAGYQARRSEIARHRRRLLNRRCDQRRHPARAGRTRRGAGPRETSYARVGAENRRDYSMDDVGLHGGVGARRGRAAEGTARDDALGATRQVARVRRRSALSARRRGRQNYHRRWSLRRYRHGAASGASRRRRHYRAGDPGGHRVRSAAALRRKRRPRAGAGHGSFAPAVSEILCVELSIRIPAGGWIIGSCNAAGGLRR